MGWFILGIVAGGVLVGAGAFVLFAWYLSKMWEH